MKAPSRDTAHGALIRVHGAIRAHHFRYSDEDQLQGALASALLSIGFDVQREVRLDGASRIDLLVGRVGVEVKVAGTVESVTRQLRRYADHDRIGGIVLVTTRVRHRQVPRSLSGKPVAVVSLAETVL
jgi:hypothetical protein